MTQILQMSAEIEKFQRTFICISGKIDMRYKHSRLTEQIIKSYYTVYNELGYGFLEKVYENAMLVELFKSGIHAERQKRIVVYYDAVEVGEYFADLMIENKVIVELKASEKLMKNDEYQFINYLKATEVEVGLLLNFGKRPEFKRKIYSNKKWNEDDSDQKVID